MAVSTQRDQAATKAALSAWLAARTGAPSVEVGEISIPGLSGFSNETLVFDAVWDDGAGPTAHGLVVRVEPEGHQVFPATEFDTQVQVMRALRATREVPVPEVRWFEDDRSVLGSRFMVMTRVIGEVPPDTPSYHVEGWFPALSETERAVRWNAGIDVLGAIHRVDLEASGLGGLPARTPAEQLDADLAYREFACGSVPFPLLDAGFGALAAAVPPPAAPPALCWGDSRLGNMIFGPDGAVAAVLDWEMVTVGDPVQDLAWYLLLDRHHHEGFDVPRLAGLPDRQASILRWEAASRRSAEHLAWYELLGGVRYAAILARVLQLLDETDVLPGGAEMAFDNTGTQLLERLLSERGVAV